MSDSNQNLSSLMDGELDADNQLFLLRRLAHDQAMTQTWRRFHLVRACLHKEMVQADCIADRVAAAIGQEQPYEESGAASSRTPRWLRPIAGGAIAASAALFAIVAINSSLLERSGPAADLEPGFVAPPTTALNQPFARQATPVSFSDMDQSQRQRLNSYVLRHNQAAGGSGFVSYIPIVSSAGAQQRQAADAEAERQAPGADSARRDLESQER
jgi:negative regulator of sigma E activity